MKYGWPRKTLGEICGFVRGPFGGSLKKSVFVADGFAVYEQQHAIYNQFEDIRYFIDDAKFRAMQRFELRPKDLIMSCSGTMGRVAIVPDNIRRGIINQALLKLTPSSAVLPEFLRYWMDSSHFQDSLNEQAGGVAIQNVASVSVLKEIQISLPPLPEQRRIIGILDEAFAGIAAAKANAEKNLQNARALFEGERHALFRQRGEAWIDTTLDKLSTNLDNRRVPITKTDRTSGEYPYYGASGIVDYVADYIFDGDTLLVSEDGANLLMRSTPIAFSVSGKYWVNNHAHILKFENMATQRFVEFYLESIKIDGYVTGAAQPKLTQRALNAIPIPIPKAVEAQAKVVGKIESVAVETQRLESLYQRKLAALDELKKSLLHQAFSGDL